MNVGLWSPSLSGGGKVSDVDELACVLNIDRNNFALVIEVQDDARLHLFRL